MKESIIFGVLSKTRDFCLYFMACMNALVQHTVSYICVMCGLWHIYILYSLHTLSVVNGKVFLCRETFTTAPSSLRGGGGGGL